MSHHAWLPFTVFMDTFPTSSTSPLAPTEYCVCYYHSTFNLIVILSCSSTPNFSFSCVCVGPHFSISVSLKLLTYSCKSDRVVSMSRQKQDIVPLLKISWANNWCIKTSHEEKSQISLLEITCCAWVGRKKIKLKERLHEGGLCVCLGKGCLERM